MSHGSDKNVPAEYEMEEHEARRMSRCVTPGGDLGSNVQRQNCISYTRSDNEAAIPTQDNIYRIRTRSYPRPRLTQPRHQSSPIAVTRTRNRRTDKVPVPYIRSVLSTNTWIATHVQSGQGRWSARFLQQPVSTCRVSHRQTSPASQLAFLIR